MICPKQGCKGKTKVMDTRKARDSIRRRRVCLKCGVSFHTCERQARLDWVPVRAI